MHPIQIFVKELFKEERIFQVDPSLEMEIFLKDIVATNNFHYERTFFSIENNCMVDVHKSFLENEIYSYDHLILV